MSSLVLTVFVELQCLVFVYRFAVAAWSEWFTLFSSSFFFFSSVNTEHKYSAHIEMGKKLFASHVYEIGVTVFAGPMYEIDVIDVARQEDHKMLMRNWTEYYNSPERHKILNVISLEFSKTGWVYLFEVRWQCFDPEGVFHRDVRNMWYSWNVCRAPAWCRYTLDLWTLRFSHFFFPLFHTPSSYSVALINVTKMNKNK